ncbi:MAG: hypothetical protein U1E05_05240 [Patescibacteria group bacterium]|nr:hypothetical protein [Patescibacteria group bacterium]
MCASWTSRRLRLGTLALCAAFVAGCAHLQTPRIDPTGQRIFAQPPIRTEPVYRDPYTVADSFEPVAVTLSPANAVAPIGSEVILVAGVVAGDRHLDMNRRLEWMLAAGSVGHFVSVSRNSFTGMLLGDFTRPRKIDNTYAIGTTSRRYEQLSRGTPSPHDDVCTVPGQGWISLTSPVEGTSYITVHAPAVYDWNARARTAVIHWVDVQFAYPPPSINRAGTTHPLTTTVTRQTNGVPCQGWTVRYRVTGGPPAGFAPDGSPTIEVPTDASGRATAELMQTEPSPGTNTIAIEVFRPAGAMADVVAAQSPGRLLVGNGSTTKTWSAAALTVQKVGPTRATVGSAITYRVVVHNPGDLPAENVVATERLPAEVEYLGTNPPAQMVGGQPQWNLGVLAPGERRVLEVNVRAKAPGSITNCVDITATGPLNATGCATTVVEAQSSAVVSGSTVDVRIEGPRQAAVGQSVRFPVLVTNRGQTPTGDLTIKTRFDEGLQHEVQDPKRTIEAKLDSVPPGQTHQIDIDFTVVKPGQWCHGVEVLGPAGVLASARACLAVTGTSPEQAVREPGLSVRKTGPMQAMVGEAAEFIIEVTATGQRTLTNVRVVDQYDPALHPQAATDGHRVENGNLVWTFPQLRPGEIASIRIRCSCLRASPKTCNRVSVSSNEGAGGNAEACLEIRDTPGGRPPSGLPPSGLPPSGLQPGPAQPGGILPADSAPQGTLSLTVTDLRGMVAAGKEFTYVIQVANGGIAADRQVVVTAVVPEGITPVRLGTTGPTEQPLFDGQTVRFQPVPEIKPGQILTYRVRVQTKKPGKATLKVQATSERHVQPLMAEETTEVFN